MNNKFATLVSMPSNGLHPFLQTTSWRQEKRTMCVNALKRATSISTARNKKELSCGKGVNALKRATSISTDEFMFVHDGWERGVNALKRATSISTVPLRNPSKIKALQRHFGK